MANKKEIERRYHRAELGINDKTKAVSFFNGKDRKIFLKGTTMKDKNIVTSKKIMEKRVKSK
jgi:hypothetical protein